MGESRQYEYRHKIPEMASVKMEIKPDPDALGASPAALSDEDVYEDAGDLEFNTNPDYQKLYLAKVPKFVWEAWDALDDDAEIQIGTIRQTNVMLPDGTSRMQLAMLLSSDVAQHQTIPKEYTLDIIQDKSENTYVFTEQDLPGFKSRSRQKFDLASANMPSRLSRAKENNNKAPGKDRYDPNKRFQPYFRKAIPKRTTLQGKIAHEVNCVPVDNPESQRLLAQRTIEQMAPKRHTKFINEDPGVTGKGYIQAGTTQASNTFKNFIRTKNPAAANRPQQQKFARIPENVLLDRLFGCFSDYRYWSMKALRQKLEQPESYLKETLEKIAVLGKSGRFASQWQLKPENLQLASARLDIAAPGAEGGGDDDSDMADGEDGDDEDVKFEDV